MKNFKAPVPVEYSNQRVLLTAQLAEYYECDVNNIKKNFNANRDRFVEGKHFFKLEGAALATFRAGFVTKSNQPNLQVTKSDAQNLQVTESGLQISPMTRTLYLWTERGAARHAKMLSTDKAWDVFELLRESYFSKKDSASAPHSQPQEEGGSAENFKVPAPVEYSNQLVLLTAQLAEFYECSVENIRDNFRKNRDRFVVGKHYFKLEGDILKAFRDEAENFRVAPHYQMSSLYLWTERGAARHAKMLSTDKAWDVFEKLEDCYFSRHSSVLTAAPAQLKSSKRSEGQKSPARVYVLLMSNNVIYFTKVGNTNDIRARVAQIKRKTGLTVKKIFFTPFMPRKDARLVEWACREELSPFKIEGEFYSADFNEVCESVNRFVKMVSAPPVGSVQNSSAFVLTSDSKKFVDKKL